MMLIYILSNGTNVATFTSSAAAEVQQQIWGLKRELWQPGCTCRKIIDM